MKRTFCFLTGLITLSGFSQNKLISGMSNKETDPVVLEVSVSEQNDTIEALKTELDQIYYADQRLRKLFTPNVTEDERKRILSEFGYSLKDFEGEGWNIVKKHDSLNLLRVEEIIARHGYPGKSLVGEPTNKSVYYVIQHSDKIEKYFPLIQKAGESGEIPMRLVAMMHDRFLIDQGKEQIYGTQIQGRRVFNKEENREEWFQFLWPIANPEQVNKLRQEMGLGGTLEEYVTSMGLEYRLYSLEEILRIIQ